MPTFTTNRTILIFDDDLSSIRAVKRFAAERGHVVLAFADRSEFLAWQESQHQAPHLSSRSCCVIFDAQFVDLMQRESVYQLIGDCPRICISRSTKPSVTFNSIRLGLFEFIEKPFRVAHLAEAVDRAFVYCDDRASQTTEFENFQQQLSALTSRELEVCRLLAAGLSSKAISYKLGIAIKTFYVHRANLMAKIGARALGELAQYRKVLGIERPLNWQPTNPCSPTCLDQND